MAVVTSGHADPCSVDVLDFLFNNDDGILTQDGGFHPEEDGLQLPDLELVRHLAKLRPFVTLMIYTYTIQVIEILLHDMIEQCF